MQNSPSIQTKKYEHLAKIDSTRTEFQTCSIGCEHFLVRTYFWKQVFGALGNFYFPSEVKLTASKYKIKWMKMVHVLLSFFQLV